ncbi:facilitated trehalose transporter Tret1-like [Coccinella septempunctata]|uniref:facilitated trehalose transporter Tret1-like n=1 Tax=Coccinella septempunctata TaxID=41139 RepID=UPI001D07E326|nr:facilitated trehalose transporter Tret1-like [Coccinella septempunctata]
MISSLLSSKNDGGVFNEYLAVIAACTVFFTLGVHQGWTSPSIPKLQSPEYPFDISNEEASYITISAPLGDIFGEILSATVVDRIGRKNTMFFAGFPILLSFVLIYFSYLTPVVLYAARFLGGVCFGVIMSISPIYTSELSRPEIRGKLGVLGACSFIYGLVAVNFVGTYFDIQVTALIFAVFALVFLVIFAQMPETPYYLLMRKRVEEAEESLSFFRRMKNVKGELQSLIDDVERQMSERGEYKDLLLNLTNRKALILLVLARIFQQMTGATVFAMYTQHLLSSVEDVIQPHFAIVIIYLIQAFVVLISGNLSDKYGRVPLMTLSAASCFFTLLLQGGYFTIRDFTDYGLPVWTPALLLGVYYILFQIGLGSLLNIMLGEMFSASIKPKAICVVNMTLSLTIMITAKFYQVCADYLHVSVCFYTFAGCSLVAAFFFKFFFLETKGKTLEEIQMELKGAKRRHSVVGS